MNAKTSEAVIEYWLGDAVVSAEESKRRSKLWYGFDPEIDRQLSQQFKTSLQQAESGELDSWCDSPEGSLALVILLDQFSRNIYRGTRDAFKNDQKALDIAQTTIENKNDTQLPLIGRAFLYHPFEHSEEIKDQQISVSLFDKLYREGHREGHREGQKDWSAQLKNFLDYAIDHRDIIVQFGRFPHRNAILGRKNTAREEAFLSKDKRTFGQK